MASARQVLLDKIVAHVAQRGLSDVSLRDLAGAVGSSHRMLLYHFGSREGLVAAIVANIEAGQRDVLRSLSEHASSPTDMVTGQWAVLTDPALRPFIRLFFEVLAQAAQQRPGTEGFLDNLTQPWIDTAGEIARRLDLPIDDVDTRLGIAVVRGLLIDVLASGDVDAPTAALQRFLQLWQASGALGGENPRAR